MNSDDLRENDPNLEAVASAFTSLSAPFPEALRQLSHPGPPPIEDDDKLTEAAHAQRFANAYGLDCKYDHRRGMWLWYDPPLWRPDRDGRIKRQLVEFAKQRQRDVLSIKNRDDREKAVAFMIKQESVSTLNRVESHARNLYPVTDTGELWDTHSWLLGAPNGIIDLRTGILRDGDPSDRISLQVRVPYDETCGPPTRWLVFLNEIFDGDVTLVEFVHRYIGYCLTGETKEQVLAVFHGRGANGKSTLLNTLSWLFGDYAYNMPFSAVELKNRQAITSDIAALDKRRFVTSSETNDGTRLNEARIKALTGGDPITARFMYADNFTFQPVAKFILSVNHRPQVADDSYGFWRRLKLVPFNRCFAGSARDDQLEPKLKLEGTAILRWAVEGCIKWQHSGLGTNSAIDEATEEYRQESDPLADFIADRCELDGEAVTTSSAMFGAYDKWAESLRVPKAERLSHKQFGKKMAEKFERRRNNVAVQYYGVRVVTEKLW